MSLARSLEIELVDVAHAHTSSVPLLAGVGFRLTAGWTGIVGANGAGKTTLLRLMAGELEPDAGQVRRSPGLRVGLCPQRVEHRDVAIDRFARAPTREAARLLGRLRLDAAQLDRWPQLSPGERKRWQLGAVLAETPGLLLLDEPTNHLDAEARELLVGALRGFPGIGVVVSHDRALLASLTAWTLRVHAGTARLYRGDYARARRAWSAAEHHEREQARALRREQRQLARRLADRQSKWNRADARTRTSRRMKGPRDSAARGAFKASRRRSAVTALGREIRKLHGRIDRVGEQADAFRLEKERGRSLFVGYAPAPRPQLLQLEAREIAVGAGGGRRVLLRDVRVTLARTDRIWLSGANGAGKTTLLLRLLASGSLPEERILHLPQELDEQTARDALARARRLPAHARGHLLQRVAALGIDPDALLASERPSPGEARKLVLAEALARQVWALILDEPTHHLDLPSRERLEAALADYPGALLVVTHDEAFAARLAETRWHVEHGAVRIGAMP